MTKKRVYVEGAEIGHLTILLRGEGGQRFTVRCDCGREFTCSLSMLGHVKAGVSTSCYGCRAETHQKACLCVHCGEQLSRPANHTNVASCGPCSERIHAAQSLLSKRRRAVETTGRVCVGCDRKDAETRWSGRVRFCSACDRMGERNGWAPCGAPIRRGRGTPRVPTCRKHGWTGCP